MKVPWCDRCGCEVADLRQEVDPMTGRLLIEARCHGRVERVTIERTEVDRLKSLRTEGVAFKTPKAPPGSRAGDVRWP